MEGRKVDIEEIPVENQGTKLLIRAENGTLQAGYSLGERDPFCWLERQNVVEASRLHQELRTPSIVMSNHSVSNLEPHHAAKSRTPSLGLSSALSIGKV